MKKHHFLIISLPAQGHINPTLQLAKNLARAGARCTFVTTVHGFRKMNNLPSIDGLFYASISDGHDDGKPKEMYFGDYLNDLKRVGSENLKNLLQKFTDDGYPVTCLVYTILFTWVAEVAREYHAPSAFLAIQCAAAFAIYYHLFSTNNGIYSSTTEIEPSFPIKLPEFPLFSRDDIPTFLLQSDSASSFMIPVMREHIKILENDPNPRVLINTFDALEEKSLKILEKIGVSSIGPLIPSAFCDGNDVNDKSFGCELFDKSENYSQWLDSKAEGSVVYISFGSLAVLKEEQKEEILKGLLESEMPFLWVIRTSNEDDKTKNENYGLNGKGMIVPWCSQMEVLFHKSIGCFMSHCGWNSTLESIAAGVPLIGYPQFSDQVTNIKMVEEVWGTGVRARAEEGIVKREELKRCLEILMGGGEKGNEIRRNVKKYGDLAMEAVKGGGSSHYNLNKFIDSL